MTYLKLDVGFPWHPRLAPLSDRAFRIHLIALCHAKAFLTDGFIARQIAVTWGLHAKQMHELEQSGLWEPCGNTGWKLHDWFDWNEPRDDIEARSRAKEEARRESGRLGGIASGIARRQRSNEANREAIASEATKQTAKHQSIAEHSRAEHSRAEDDADVGYRDRYGTIVEALGVPYPDRRLADEIDLLAADECLEALQAAIAQCRRDNVRPWPREIRRRLPDTTTTVDDRRARYSAPAPAIEPDELAELRARRIGGTA